MFIDRLIGLVVSGNGVIAFVDGLAGFYCFASQIDDNFGFAVESYSYQTIDYLLKPITLKRFLASVEKIEQHFLKPGPEYPLNAEQGPEFFS